MLDASSRQHEMTRRQMFRAADLARALKVAQAAGLTISRVEIDPDGSIKLTFGQNEQDRDRAEAIADLEALRVRLKKQRAERQAEKAAALVAGLPIPKRRHKRPPS